MIKIAIIDDLINTCEQIEKYLYDIGNRYGLKIEVEPYYSGESFCCDLNKGEIFDLVFIDIKLKNMSGIEVSRYIRTSMEDELQQIVFISASKQYSLELHSFHPLDFLVKEITESDIEKVIIRFLKIIRIEKDTFECKIGHDIKKIKIRNIQYLTISNRLVYVILKDNKTIEYYGTLESAYHEQLQYFNFIFLHKQFIVNPTYIEIYGYDRVILISGKVIPIGSSKRKKIRNWLVENNITGR